MKKYSVYIPIIHTIFDYFQILGQYHERLVQEKIDFMKQFSFFSEWSTSKMLSLWELFKKQSYTKNSIVYKEGDNTDGIYFVKQGEIEVRILKF